MWQFPDMPAHCGVGHTGTPEPVFTIFGKRLPSVRGVVSLFVQSRQIRLYAQDGSLMTLHETEPDFPSDKLLAQVTLVSGV